MVAFAVHYYYVAQFASIFAGIAVLVLSYKIAAENGMPPMMRPIAALLGVLLTFAPMIAFEEQQNGVAYAWALYAAVALKLIVITLAHRKMHGFLRVGVFRNGIVIFALIYAFGLTSASWFARSVELTVKLASLGSLNILFAIVGALYAVVYLLAEVFFIPAIQDMNIRTGANTKGVLKFLEKKLASENVKTRRRALSALDDIQDEPAYRLLIRQAAIDADAELRAEAQGMAQRKKDMPPELLAELQAVLGVEQCDLGGI